MPEKTLADLSKTMSDIDFVMLLTKTQGGAIAGRPMSNNGDVEYEGDSFYFTWEDSRMVEDITRDPQVTLSFQGNKGLFGSPPVMIAVEGRGEIIRDKAAFAEHWNSGLERWFEQGVDTPGMAMIRVHADRIHYWDGEDEGELRL